MIMSENDMEDFREEVKLWLRKNNVRRSDIASRVGITLKTFNRWMSDKPIPSLKRELLRELMENHEDEEPEDLWAFLGFTPEQAKDLRDRANRNGLTPGEYCERLINDYEIIRRVVRNI